MNIFRLIKQLIVTKKIENNPLYSELIKCTYEAYHYLHNMFHDNNKLIEPEIIEQYACLYNKAYDLFKMINAELKGINEISGYIVALDMATDFIFGYDYKRALKLVQEHNEHISCYKTAEIADIVNPIENNKNLDEQQLKAIAKNTHSNLILAGAGTGKTTTIIGLVKYLIKAKIYKPWEILLISFTNKTVDDMKKRINKELGGVSCNITTFHKLGKNIISAAQDNIQPTPITFDLEKFVEKELKQRLCDINYANKLYTYMLCYHSDISSDPIDFYCNEQYEAYLLSHPPTTLNKEIVKSYGEMEIANFLYSNEINYKYEEPYKINTATDKYRQYCPDFYLPDYDIYIEYFALDSEGNVPEWFTGDTVEQATEKYKKSIAWKRKLHKKNNTIMIELFYSHKQKCTLIQRLKTQLEEQLKKRDKIIKFCDTNKFISNDCEVRKIAKELASMIDLIKSENISFNEFEHNKQNFSGKNLLIDILRPLMNAYENELLQRGEIDFNDMINKAVDYVKSKQYQHKYRYVIVDEYQDISKSCLNLLYELRRTNDFKLFCVGDDWQSIYNFAGSNIDYIIHFERYWGYSEQSKIETTYRFPEDICNVSGKFIMKNPIQIKKDIHNPFINTEISLKTILIQQLESALLSLPDNGSVMFLGRNNSDIEILKKMPNITYYFKNDLKIQKVIFSKRKDLDITYSTIHKSKGIETEYVFLLNMRDSDSGFPVRKTEPNVVRVFRKQTETYPLAEERRLFYVAITRAKKCTWLVLEKDNISEFAQEIIFLMKSIRKEKFLNS